MISSALLERVLARLELNERPTTDLAALNRIYAAFSANIGSRPAFAAKDPTIKSDSVT